MFGINQYVPILKGKEGEFMALQRLSPEVRAGLTPFIDVQQREKAPQWIAKKLLKSWGVMRPIFLDFRYLSPSPETLLDSHPIVEMAQLARDQELRVIIALGHERSDEYVAAVRRAREICSCQVCVRLTPESMSDLAFLRDGIPKLLEQAGAVQQFAHLLLDFGFVEPHEVNAKAALAVRALTTVKNLHAYSSVILVATGFPFNLMGIPMDHVIDRTEVALWDRVRDAGVPRVPIFGDYGIAHPEVDNTMDPRKMNPSPSVRYTAEGKWVIIKRRSKKRKSKPTKGKVATRKRDYTPFLQVCRDLMGQDVYCGREFSRGDEEIFRIARGTKKEPGPGSPTVWRRIGTNHHLSFVVLREANHFAGKKP
jgi:hypothetical protein